MPYVTGAPLGGIGPERLFIRDVQDRLTPNDTQRTTLIVAGVYIAVIAILWYVATL